RPLLFEHEGNRALIEGDWKLVAKGPKGKWELYDLAADRNELRDLAPTHPDRVRAMAARWQSEARRTHILPSPFLP
ncbi:MAG TPA: arylsulfatase, partial [Candidatus Spyradenecus faecavium]|nr:arylsulfatase [Candidatus Spyradenecus faecavium]